MAGIRGGFRNPLLTGVEIPDGTIDEDMIADGAVSSLKIAANLQSDNYDGGVIAVDEGTVGWRIERNTGDAVFSDIIARGSIEASTVTGSTITGSLFRTAASGERLEIDGSTGDSFIELYNSLGSLVGFVGWGPTGYGASDLVISTEANLNPIVISADGGVELTAGGSAGFGVHVTNGAPAGALPSYPFIVESATGAGFRVVDTTSATNGPHWVFDADTNTGIGRSEENGIGFWLGGAKDVYIHSDEFTISTNGYNSHIPYVNGNIYLTAGSGGEWYFRRWSGSYTTLIRFKDDSSIYESMRLYDAQGDNLIVWSNNPYTNGTGDYTAYWDNDIDGTNVGWAIMTTLSSGRAVKRSVRDYAEDQVGEAFLRIPLRSWKYNRAAYSRLDPRFKASCNLTGKVPKDDDGDTRHWFIAEEVESELPWLVGQPDGDPVKRIKDGRPLQVAMIAALRYLDRRVAELESKLTTIREEIAT